MSRQGNISEVVKLMKGYFSSKRKHPWHRIFKDIEKYWPKKEKGKLKETLLLLRAAVFSAFDALSIAVGSDLTTEGVLQVFIKGEDWSDARKRVRRLCSDTIRKMITKGEIRYLQESALRRDGFAYHVGPLEEKKWQSFKQAKPSIKRGKLDLTKLAKVELGCSFLREQEISELKIPKDDERVPIILEAYEHYLVEYEVDRDSKVPIPTDTEQVTLNGSPISDSDEVSPKKVSKSEGTDDSVQAQLTEFTKPKKKSGKKRSSRRKKSSSKKKKRKKGGRK